jgi:hypothetical protein
MSLSPNLEPPQGNFLSGKRERERERERESRGGRGRGAGGEAASS